MAPPPDLPFSDSLGNAALRAAAEAMAEGIVVQDAAGAILAANEAAHRILGLSLAQMKGVEPADPAWHLTWRDGTPLPDDDLPASITLRTGEPCRGVQVLVHGVAAQPRALSVNSVALRDATNTLMGCVSTFRDVTEEVAVQQSRDQVRELLETITRAVPGALFQFLRRHDGRMECQYISPQAQAALGVGVGDDADALFRRVHPEDLAGLMDLLRATAASVDGGARSAGADQLLHQFRFALARGEWRWVEVRVRGERSADGVRFHGFAHDVTERQLLAARLRETQREELTGQLAAGLSHNFNNMLSVILPNLETLLREVPASLRVEVEDAHRAAQNAAELVRQLMQLVRHEAVDGAEVVDLGMLVHQVLRICRRTFDRRIAIEEAVPAGALPVRAGRAALEQVVLNLCLNARDAMDEAPMPRLAVRVQAAGSTGQVCLEVEDNGCGMTDDVKARLAEPFFTTKPPGRGTGLGLTSAFGIVRELGGRIEVESAVGRGTTFRVWLPVVDATPSRTTPPPLAPSVAAPAAQQVLVVDDEHLIRTTASRMLTRLGFEPLTAEDGHKGLAALERHPAVAAVIVDVSMPGMSGPEVLARIRALRPELPVILSSGYLADGVDVTAASAVLTKPYDSAAMMAALTRVLPGGAARPAAH